MHKNKGAFTVVELLVVIVVIGILATITVVGVTTVQRNGRDSTREMKAKEIATSLEKYYQDNGEYPGCNALTQSVATVANQTLVGLNPSSLTTPTAASGTNSIYCGDISGSSVDSFGYVGDGTSKCTTTVNGACTQFTLQYRDEASGGVKVIDSKHRASIVSLSSPVATATVASSTSVKVSWGYVPSAENYSIDYSTSSTLSSPTTVNNISSSSFTVSNLTQGMPYFFRVKAYAAGVTPSQSSIVSATTSVDTPSSPSVTASMSGSNAVGTVNAIDCPASTTPYYAIRSNVNDGSWSSWSSYTSSPSTSTITSTNQGYKYGFNAAAKCQGNSASSGIASNNTASTIRPIDTPATPVWNTGNWYWSSQDFVVDYISYCPSGTWLVNAQYRSYPWPLATPRIYYYDPWGFVDAYEGWMWSDQTVEFWGYYQCATNYTVSPQSPWSYNTVTIHREGS